MLYRFPAIFYKTSPSPCAPFGDTGALSDGDRLGLLHLYPRDAGSAQVEQRQRSILEAIVESGRVEEGLESVGANRPNPYLEATAAVLARNHAE